MVRTISTRVPPFPFSRSEMVAWRVLALDASWTCVMPLALRARAIDAPKIFDDLMTWLIYLLYDKAYMPSTYGLSYGFHLYAMPYNHDVYGIAYDVQTDVSKQRLLCVRRVGNLIDFPRHSHL